MFQRFFVCLVELGKFWHARMHACRSISGEKEARD